MFVYLLRSEKDPSKKYIGLTNNLERRLAEHNQGKSLHTNKFRPWQIVVSLWFQNHQTAESFESYLKKGSGHAFARRHLW